MKSEKKEILTEILSHFNELDEVGAENYYISEITLTELKFGVANSIQKNKTEKVLKDFINGIKIIPIYNSLDLHAEEKTKLRKSWISLPTPGRFD